MQVIQGSQAAFYCCTSSKSTQTDSSILSRAQPYSHQKAFGRGWGDTWSGTVFIYRSRSFQSIAGQCFHFSRKRGEPHSQREACFFPGSASPATSKAISQEPQTGMDRGLSPSMLCWSLRLRGFAICFLGKGGRQQSCDCWRLGMNS